MVTHLDRNIIDRTLGLLTKISCDMQEVLKSAPIYNIGIERLEIQRIKDQYLEVTAHLQNTYYFICDNWEKPKATPYSDTEYGCSPTNTTNSKTQSSPLPTTTTTIRKK